MSEANEVDGVVMRGTKQLRDEFEKTINGLQGVKYSLHRGENGEYSQAAVFHMWSGYCLAALDNGICTRNEYGFIDGYA